MKRLESLIRPKTGPLPAKTFLHHQIQQAFSEGELRDVCLSIGCDFEELEGDTKGERCLSLALWASRHGKTGELLGVCRELRPNVGWAG